MTEPTCAWCGSHSHLHDDCPRPGRQPVVSKTETPEPFNVEASAYDLCPVGPSAHRALRRAERPCGECSRVEVTLRRAIEHGRRLGAKEMRDRAAEAIAWASPPTCTACHDMSASFAEQRIRALPLPGEEDT